MRRTVAAILVAGALLGGLALAGVQAQGPAPSAPGLQGEIHASDDTVNFQGRLYTSSGSPAPAGNYNMAFSICSDSGCANAVWGPNEFTAAVDAEGLFNVLLTGLDADHFTGDRWLRIQVCQTVNQSPCTSGWDDMTPYQPMTSVAIAIGNIRKNVQDTSVAAVDGAWLLEIENTGTGAALFGHAPDAIGVRGNSTNDAGIVGWSDTWAGVYARSDTSIGTYSYSNYDRGVLGITYALDGTGDEGVTGIAEIAGSYYGPPSGDNAGVLGSVEHMDDYGVFGINAYTETLGGAGYGVVGVAAGTSFSLPPNGWSAGVVGSVGTADDAGVYGSNSDTSGQAYGVVGVASTNSVVHPTSGSVGVLGSVTRSGDFGVYGANNHTSGGYGVYGTGHYGVYGYSPSLYGMYGRSDSTSGRGGYFYAPGDPADVAASAGAYGRSDADSGFGLAGHHYWYGVGVGAWSYGGNLIEAYDGDYPGGDLEFYVDQSGWGWFNGGYGSFAGGSPNPEGQDYFLYGIQSPEVWFEDFGTATLTDGRAVVEIEPRFAQTVNLEEDYHVFLTPLGGCSSLYVANKTPTSFEVREQGEDKANVAFDYRIVAKRVGYETLRMDPLPVEAPSSEEILARQEALDAVEVVGTGQVPTSNTTAQPQQLPDLGTENNGGAITVGTIVGR